MAIQSRPALMFSVQIAFVSCSVTQPKSFAAHPIDGPPSKYASSSPVPLNLALPKWRTAASTFHTFATFGAINGKACIASSSSFHVDGNSSHSTFALLRTLRYEKVSHGGISYDLRIDEGRLAATW